MRIAALLVLALAACASGPTPEEEFNLALSGRDPVQALRLLDHAIAARPAPAFLAERARIHLILQERNEALADYTAALQQMTADAHDSASRARLLLQRALLFLATGRTREALADLDEALRLAPDYTEARLERAGLLRKAGRSEDADRDVLAARRSGADQVDFFYNEAVRLLTLNDRPQAERMIEFTLELDPGHSRAHVARARLSMERGRFDEAARELDLAIPVHPQEADLYYSRGTALLVLGRAAPALEDFEKAAELDPREPRYFAARGMARFRARKDLEGARKDFETAIRLDDACHAAWFNRGVLEFERGEYEEAEKDLRHALALRASPEGSVALARVFQKRGQSGNAADLLRRAAEIFRTPETQRVLRDELDRIEQDKENKP